MGCRIIVGNQESRDGIEAAVLFCSTTGVAFGPVMGSQEEAEAFIKFCPEDPRTYSDNDLMEKHSEFMRQYVCECGSIADGVQGQDEAEEGKPLYGYPRTDGERFTCDYCVQKAPARGRRTQPHVLGDCDESVRRK